MSGERGTWGYRGRSARPRGVLPFGLLLLLVGACGVSAFTCEDDTACIDGRTQGVCEPSGHCSFPDEACPSGRRYGRHAGERSNTCVGDDEAADDSTSDDSGSTSMAEPDTSTGVGADTGADATTTSTTWTEDDSTGERVPPPTNFVFVSSTGQPPGDLGGLEGADALCNTLAAEVDLPGTYVAWLSTPEVDARDRLGTARGWIRVDGRPFADTVDDLLAGEIFYPIRLDETGADAEGALAATATEQDGTLTPDYDCDGWTTTDGSSRGGRSDTSVWSSTQGFGCGNANVRIYCFGIDLQTEVAVEPSRQRYAFLANDVSGSAGLSMFDARCASEAEAAGLPGSYRAFVATPTQSASGRFDLAGAPWGLPNGVLITEEAGDLASGNLLSPIWRAADGSQATGDVWTGADSPTVTSPLSCGNWNDATLMGHSGRSNRSHAFMGVAFNSNCTINRRLFCLQE
jgi:hypothetical protein